MGSITIHHPTHNSMKSGYSTFRNGVYIHNFHQVSLRSKELAETLVWGWWYVDHLWIFFIILKTSKLNKIVRATLTEYIVFAVYNNSVLALKLFQGIHSLWSHFLQGGFIWSCLGASDWRVVLSGESHSLLELTPTYTRNCYIAKYIAQSYLPSRGTPACILHWTVISNCACAW